MQNLFEWLSKIGLEQHTQTMIDNDIDLDLLPDITDEDLKELGLSIGHRRRILTAAGHIPGIAQPVPTVETVDAADIKQSQSSADDHPEHRQLTVMFCDLAASTEMSQILSSEELRKITLAYQDECERTIKQHQGFVARYMGDGILAYFGYPQAHEDDAVLAVRAGLAIVTAIQSLNTRFELPRGVPLAVRVGIATGSVIVGDLIGKGPSQESAVVGETPNLAARLQGLAELNSVVISPTTCRLTKDYFDLVSLGAKAIKGFYSEIEVWQVAGAKQPDDGLAGTDSVFHTRLVGREEEISILMRRWEKSKAGKGQVVFLSGEPGIGKSRLLHYLRNASESSGAIRLKYNCSQHHTNSPLYPFIQQVEFVAGFEHADDNTEKIDKLIALLELSGEVDPTHLALLSSLLSIENDGRIQAFEGTSKQQRNATLEMFLQQLHLFANKGPVLIAFEDLHWVDPSSQELLDRIIENISELPVVLVLTFRPEFICPWTGLPHSMFLTLNRINKEEMLAIVDSLTGGKNALDEKLVAHILSRTDGVPLFVEEMTKMLLDTGQAGAPSDAVDNDDQNKHSPPPETLRDSLTARLDRLKSAKPIAQICAVTGRQVDYRLIEMVAGMESAQLQQALAKLVEMDLMSCRGTVPDSVYTFKHALIQDTAYQSMLSERRAEIHGRIADTIQDHFPQDIERRPEIIAQHYMLSGRLPLALDYFEKAGNRMLSRSNYKEGIHYLRQAIKIIQMQDESSERNAREIAVQIAMGGAMIATKGFAAQETGDTYTRAANLIKNLGGDTSRFNPIRYGVWVVHLVRGEFDIAYELADEFVTEAEQQDNPTGHLVAHRTLGSCLTFMGKWEQAIEHLDISLSLYDPKEHHSLAVSYAQDPRIAALSLKSWALLHRGRIREAIATADQAVEEAYKFEHLHTTAYTLGLAGTMVHQFYGNLNRSRQGADALVALCSAQPVPLWSNLGSCLLGWSIGMSGDIDEGMSRLQAGYDGFVSTGARLFLPYYCALKAELHVEAGEYEKAVSALEEAEGLQKVNAEGWFESGYYRIRGDLLLKMESFELARAAYQTGMERAKRKDDLLNQLRCAIGLVKLANSADSIQSNQQSLREIIQLFESADYHKGVNNSEFTDVTQAKALI